MKSLTDNKKSFEKMQKIKQNIIEYQRKIEDYNNMIHKEQNSNCSHDYKVVIKNYHRNSDKEYYICQCLCCNARYFIGKNDDLLLDNRIININNFTNFENSIIDEINRNFEIKFLNNLQNIFDGFILSCPNNFNYSYEYVVSYIIKAIKKIYNSYLNIDKDDKIKVKKLK